MMGKKWIWIVSAVIIVVVLFIVFWPKGSDSVQSPVTPTQTSNATPTPTSTPTQTSTSSQTTPTPTIKETFTPTPTTTAVIPKLTVYIVSLHKSDLPADLNDWLGKVWDITLNNGVKVSYHGDDPHVVAWLKGNSFYLGGHDERYLTNVIINGALTFNDGRVLKQQIDDSAPMELTVTGLRIDLTPWLMLGGIKSITIEVSY